MLEEGMITQEEHDEAVNYKMVFTNSEDYVPSGDLASQQTQTETKIQSYYVDYVIQSVIQDLMDKYGYTRSQASSMIYSGGLRIYSAVDMDIQEAMETVYVNKISFPKYNKKIDDAQSAMTIMDYSGRIVGMVGGAGEKTENRGLNRAANSYRQPGSSIKPLTIYAPAIENKYVTWSTRVRNYGIPNYYTDGKNGGYGPVNYGNDPGSPDSYVNVQKAICKSYNTVPAQILRQMGYQKSFDFATQKFRLSTLVDPTDINASSLAVGGTYKGVSTLQMAAAYASFGNGGKYFEPYCYYKVTNSTGTEVLLQHDKTDGDQIMAICAARLKAQGKLQNNGFVATIMSNLGLHKFAKEHDMNLLCSGVGDRHVLELMREKGLILGGEQSGHIIFLNHMTTGDGQLAALQFLQILSTSGMTVSQLAATVPQYPQHLENVKAPFEQADKQALLESDGVKAAIAEAEAMLGEEGRVLVRPSGTEALIRVMAEAGTQELAEKAVALVAASVENAQNGN